MPELNHHQTLLMENCDLPPPTKLFACYIDNPIYAAEADSKSMLGKALQLSKTRAREAERRLEESQRERDHALNALVSESMRVIAYRRWIMMLEIHVEMLKLETMEEADEWLRHRDVAEGDGGGEDGVEKWKLGFVICLGLAGLSVAYKLGFL